MDNTLEGGLMKEVAKNNNNKEMTIQKFGQSLNDFVIFCLKY